MKRILFVVLMSLAMLASVSVSHPVAKAAPHKFMTCGSNGYWKDEYDTGRFTAGFGIDEDVSLEAWTDQTLGTYCGFIRSKDTFFYSCHTQAIDMQTWLSNNNNGKLQPSFNEATWNGCSGSYYALFGFEIQSSLYACPFQAVGAAVFGTQGYGSATAPHCTL